MDSTSSAFISSIVNSCACQNFDSSLPSMIPPTLSQSFLPYCSEACSEPQNLIPSSSLSVAPFYMQNSSLSVAPFYMQNEMLMGVIPSIQQMSSTPLLRFDIDRRMRDLNENNFQLTSNSPLLKLDIEGCIREIDERNLQMYHGQSVGIRTDTLISMQRSLNISDSLNRNFLTNSSSAIAATSYSNMNDPSLSPPTNAYNNQKLTLVLEKKLSTTDVKIGRIIVPKRVAAYKLPLLEDKGGITLIVRDALSSNTWKMKYRYWPNNSSRMYVLENTGDFTKRYDLKCGDSLAIYQDDLQQNFICAKKKRESCTGAKKKGESCAGAKRKRESLFPSELISDEDREKMINNEGDLKQNFICVKKGESPFFPLELDSDQGIETMVNFQEDLKQNFIWAKKKGKSPLPPSELDPHEGIGTTTDYQTAGQSNEHLESRQQASPFNISCDGGGPSTPAINYQTTAQSNEHLEVRQVASLSNISCDGAGPSTPAREDPLKWLEIWLESYLSDGPSDLNDNNSQDQFGGF